MQRRLLAAALAALIAGPAYGESAEPAPAPTVLHLSQSAERRLPRDILHVTLRAEKSGADAQIVEAAINESMAKALAQARQVTGVAVATGSYAVYRETPKDHPPQWSGSQSLFLSGSHAGPLLNLAGALQAAGLLMSNLSYEMSHEAMRGAEDDLTAEALSALERRAAAIAQHLHQAVLGYRDLTVGNAETGEGPMPRFAAAAVAAMPTPVAAPGEATVRVTVSAEILLAPKQP